MELPIFVVSGLPRSGTSMMMRMLQAGGMDLVTDDIRTADEDNKRGYFEFEPVKKLKEDASWLPAAQGKVVKIISLLLMQLPETFTFRVIFMRRNLDEVLASQQKMIKRRGTVGQQAGSMGPIYEKHLAAVEAWLAAKANFETYYVNYSDLFHNPSENVAAISAFCGRALDLSAMGSVIDPSLYRNRA